MPSAAQKQKKDIRVQHRMPFCERTSVFYFTASLNALPALKAGALDAGISICSLVCGFKPVRAARSLSSNVPNPTSCTLSPFLTAPMISSIRASRTAPASFFRYACFFRDSRDQICFRHNISSLTRPPKRGGNFAYIIQKEVEWRK